MTIWSLVSRIEFLILFRDEKFSFMIDDTCFRILFKIVRGNRELQLDYYVKRLTIHVRFEIKIFERVRIQGAKVFGLTHEFEEMVHIH